MWEWLLVSLVGVSIFGYVCHIAPEGYEDETGFHYGVDLKDQAILDKMNK